METIVTSIGEELACYDDLHEWARSFGDDPNIPSSPPLSYLEGDPDILRCDGSRLCFISTVQNGKRHVLTLDKASDTERQMLTRFFEEEFRRHFEPLPCSWGAFESARRAIAYRGGSGYVYSIWGYAA